MTIIQDLVHTLRRGVKSQSALIGKTFGYNLLDKAATEALLQPGQLAAAEPRTVHMPAVADGVDPERLRFEASTVTTSRTRVWQYDNADGRGSLLRSGGLKVGTKVLDTDFGTNAVLKDLLSPQKRELRQTDTLIAPWSHYWGGYYDYLFFVLAKLCRIKESLSASVFAEAVVAYPLLHTAFERELLDLIGVKPENRVDSRRQQVRFNTGILGSNDRWFYPHPDDLAALKKQILTNVAIEDTGFKRIYISRSGRRRVLNEDALIALLRPYGFDIIEDRPRSIAEQVALYRSASFIIGPHGASFSNVLWCQPGTYLFELFAEGYRPDYFRYLAQTTGMQYAAYSPDPQAARSNDYVDHRNVNKDLTVSIAHIEQCLNRLLSRNATVYEIGHS